MRTALSNILAFSQLLWTTDKIRCVLVLALRAVSSVLPIGILWVGKLIVDAVAELSISQDPARVWRLLGIEAILFITSDVIGRTLSVTESILGERFSHHLLTRVLQQANKLDLESFEDASFFDRLERARNQANSRLGVLSSGAQFVQQVGTVVCLLISATAIAPLLALAQVLSITPVILSEAYYTRFWHRLYREQTPRRREIEYILQLGTLPGMAKEARAFRLGQFLESWLHRVGKALLRDNARLATRRNLAAGAFNVVGMGAYYAGYAYIAWRAGRGLATVGDVVLLAGILQKTRTDVQGIFSLLTRTAEQAVQLGDLLEFLRFAPRMSSASKPMGHIPGPRPNRRGLVVEHVGFQYTGTSQPVLRDCNFHIEIGTRLALVGENGSGKSTLVKLLMRLYDPTEGRILFDGIDLRDYDPETLRAMIAPVFQDFVRYDLTVRQNISFERAENDEEVWRAANHVKASRIINGLPAKMDQMLGRRFQNGMDLSGGQWQQIALARAWLQNARLVILDEPTAAIDARAEHELASVFSDLTKDRMAVLISHRFSTIRMADRIVVLSDGRTIEEGTHDHLISQGGHYSELFELQAAGYR